LMCAQTCSCQRASSSAVARGGRACLLSTLNPAPACLSCRMASKVKVAVLGTGSLGKEHVRIYEQLDSARQVELVGIYDINKEIVRHLAMKHRTYAYESLAEIVDEADAVSIVTPTSTHFELAKSFLQQGKHVLVEKPMTDD